MSILAEDNITITSQKTVGDNAAAYTDAAVEGLVPMTGHAEGAIANFEDLLIKDLVTDINPVQDLSGGNPSPTNICPISGSTEANVYRTGKNLLENTGDATTAPNGVTFVKNADGSVTANGTASANAQYTIGLDTSMLNGDFYFVGCYTAQTGVDAYMWDVTTSARLKKWNGTTDSASSTNGTLQQIKIPKGHNVRLVMRVSSGVNVNDYVFRPMICVSTETDATYEPYNGTTYNVDWTADAGTVYGGALDVTTGVLTVTHGFAEYDGSDDENWTGGSPRYAIIPSDVYQSGSGRMEVVANEFLYSSSATSVGTIFLAAGSGQIFVYPPVADSLANFKTWLSSNPLQGV